MTGSKKYAWLFGVVTIALVALYTYLAATGNSIYVPDILRTFLFKIFQLTAIVAVWGIYDHIHFKDDGILLKHAAPASFFIYVLHEPVQHIIFQTILMPDSPDWLHMVIYFAVPVVLVILIILLAKIINHISPGLACVLTGNRTGRTNK